ncbi:hypothetical protein [Miltoncostaea marina]|uniref:hypothetical protein n=1 Tax=Miltoncostaea marina TaxID=2843215 RepID=UPI001C3D5515|nr:hypothetical protein [Miltoncostaea marina]
MAAAAALVAGAGPAAAQAPSGLSGAFDPAASGAHVAVAGSGAAGPVVLVRRPGGPPLRYEDARSPAIDGERLAYVDSAGVRLVAWRSGQELGRVDGARLMKPALDWPDLAYVRRTRTGGQVLELVNLVTRRTRVVARVGRHVDLGRPALRGGLIAWHVAAGRWSEIRVSPVRRLTRGRVIATSVTGLQVNPSLAQGRVAWVEHAGSDSFLRIRAVRGGPVRTLLSQRGARRILWTTALGASRAYVTRWNVNRGRGEVVGRRWR